MARGTQSGARETLMLLLLACVLSLPVILENMCTSTSLFGIFQKPFGSCLLRPPFISSIKQNQYFTTGTRVRIYIYIDTYQRVYTVYTHRKYYRLPFAVRMRESASELNFHLAVASPGFAGAVLLSQHDVCVDRDDHGGLYGSSAHRI